MHILKRRDYGGSDEPKEFDCISDQRDAEEALQTSPADGNQKVC